MEADTGALEIKVFTTQAFDRLKTRIVKVEMTYKTWILSIESVNEDPVLKVNHVDTGFPYLREDVFATRATTHFVFLGAFGVGFYTDLKTRFYIKMDKYYSEKVRSIFEIPMTYFCVF